MNIKNNKNEEQNSSVSILQAIFNAHFIAVYCISVRQIVTYFSCVFCINCWINKYLNLFSECNLTNNYNNLYYN